MDRAEVKRSTRGEDVASTFPVPITRSHLLSTTPTLCSEQGTQVPRGWETTATVASLERRDVAEEHVGLSERI
jgi:hypothetical protein